MLPVDTFLHFSVATSLALHAMAFISSQPDRLVSAREIASALDGSEAHLHKVLKLLVKAKILKSVRGPKGGVMLRKPVENIKLIDIETDDPDGPFGAKEASEGSIVSTPPAVVSAIHDATGIWFNEFPLTPERVLRGLGKI